MITRLPKADLNQQFHDVFGESRITDTGKPGGEPRLVYHGTKDVFSRFRVSDRGTFGSGIYFASSPMQAQIFGGEDDGTLVMEAFLMMRRPYHFRIREPLTVDSWGEGLVLELFETEKANALIQAALNGDGAFGAEIMEYLRSVGHDGIVATYEDGTQELVVFDPDQVMVVSGSADESMQELDAAQGAAARESLNVGAYEHRALLSYLAGDDVTLYHGTTEEGARKLLAAGSEEIAPVWANLGKRSLLYVTTHPENATWYSHDAGGSVVLSVRIPAARLGCNPEDRVHETVIEELKAADRTGIPASLVVWGALPASAFSLQLVPPASANAEKGENWLVETKVVDAEGLPRMVYHGTNAEFDVFDVERLGANFSNEFSRQGIFFSSERYVAESVADQVTEEFGGKARVIQAFLALTNPVRIDMKQKSDDAAVLQLLTDAKARGHDGAIIENWHCGISAVPETQYVAFDPAQVHIVSPEKPARASDRSEFSEWSSGTKVTDPDGQPLMVFHGTADDFSEFGADHIGKRHVDLEVGDAYFFTNDVKTANWYATSAAKAAGGAGANVIPVYLALRNPMIVDFQGTGIETLAEDIEDAKTRGHDGLIALNYDDGKISDHYIAFHPWQIRPALSHAGRPIQVPKPLPSKPQRKSRRP